MLIFRYILLYDIFDIKIDFFSCFLEPPPKKCSIINRYIDFLMVNRSILNAFRYFRYLNRFFFLLYVHPYPDLIAIVNFVAICIAFIRLSLVISRTGSTSHVHVVPDLSATGVEIDR